MTQVSVIVPIYGVEKDFLDLPNETKITKFIFGDKIEYSKSAYETLEGSDAMLLLTEWNEFRRPDFERIKDLLNKPVIFDGRNQYDEKRMKEKGFEYFCIGKNV